jgi:hypothetical protein
VNGSLDLKLGRPRKLRDEELMEQVQAHLSNVELLATAYDSGSIFVSGLLAVALDNVLTDLPVSKIFRANLTFQGPVGPSHYGMDERRMLSPLHKLFVTRIGGSSPEAECIPVFREASAGATEMQQMDFKTWWNRDVVFRAGAAKPELNLGAGVVAMWPEDHVPYEQRVTLTRREIVKTLRNKIGGHVNTEIPELLDRLRTGQLLSFNAVVSTEDGSTRSLAEGTLPLLASPMDASVRQIAFELLAARNGQDNQVGIAHQATASV